MPEPCGIAAIVLAAGSSSRFGSDKLLHPVVQQGVALPLAAHSLRPWLENFERITVVVRPGAETFCSAITAALGATASASIHWSACQDAVQGMAASLACGVRANLEAAGWVIGLADMPAIPSAAITGVRDALLAGADMSAVMRDGRRGHPAGFSRLYGEELLALKGDAGARHLLERDKSNLVQIEIGDNGIFADIDVPDDLQRI